MFWLLRRRAARRTGWVFGLLLVAGAATAADPPKTYYLNKDGTVTARLDAVETKVESLQDTVDALRKRVAFLEGTKEQFRPPAPAQASAPAKAPATPVQVTPVPAYQGHTHTCSRGHTWDHSMDGGSHHCPACGEFQNVVDQGPPRRTYSSAPVVRYVRQPVLYTPGCGPGGCPPRQGVFRQSDTKGRWQ